MELAVELRRLLEEMTDGVLAVDQEGQIRFANRALEALSGYSKGQLLNMRLEDLVPEPERESHERQRLTYQRAASPPRPMGVDLDIHFRRHDGSVFPADIALSPVQTTGGVPVVVAAIREKVGGRRGENLAPQVQQVERDLHERALQTLFGLSLNLQTMAAQVSDQGISDRLQVAIHQVDDVVRDLRNYIFGLRPGILSSPASGSEHPPGGAV